MSGTTPHLVLSDTVRSARTDGRPIVALESTIITHGMPYPRNVETARAVEETVRSHGAVPATIALMDGVVRIGLEDAEIERLGRATDARKVSRRDLAVALVAGALGGTTVAATMIVAHLAGIRVFATGGIGGVHRGAGTTFDISADLQELARTPVAVVSAGFKSILDLGLTLEYLETHGVPVIGYGTDTLPAFYTRDSDHAVTHRMDDPAEIAQVLHTGAELGLAAGSVIACPIPESASMDRASIEAAISQAVAEAETQGVTGTATTPFLLDRITQLTGAESLESNVALIVNNASVAAQIAAALESL